MLERPTIRIWPAALCAASMLTGCGKEPPPTSVNEFMENSILLEATMVRCAEDRLDARYDAECINAREAVDRLAAAEQAARRAELEAQSDRKRQALRRAQEAAAEARRRATEEQKRREEAEYFGQFEPLPGDQAGPRTTPVEPPAGDETPPPREGDPGETGTPPADEPPAAAVPDTQPPATENPDLDSIRRELERRQSEDTSATADEDPR